MLRILKVPSFETAIQQPDWYTGWLFAGAYLEYSG